MKHLFTLLFSLLFTSLFSQIANKTIEINNIATIVNADGALFWDYDSNYYEVPKGSNINIFYAGNIWLGGFDENNTLRVAASTYNINGNDFQSGFIGSDKDELNNVWKISKTEIKKLRRDFDTDNEINTEIPTDILMYPAFGNPNVLGTKTGNPVNITVNYLPFEDRNQDGIYNVYDGDLPIINGDMQLTWLINDNGIHYNTIGTPLEFDIVGMLYANECSSDGLIDNTLFLKYDLINRSIHTLDSFRFGMWLDADLGCDRDDFTGCSIPTNSFYFYNEKGIDGDGGCFGVPSYGVNIPIQSVTYLNRNLDAFICYFNAHPFDAPADAQEYYNYLTGSWRDGTPFTYGGFGAWGTTIPYPYVYFENPSDSNSISMAGQGVVSAYFRTTGATALPQIKPNEMQTIEMAYVTHENIPHPMPDIVPVENRITQVQNHYNSELMDWDVYLGANQTLEIGQSVTITANVDNPNPTYTYLWSNGETTETIEVVTPNTYSVTVTNNETGCTKTDTVRVAFSEETLAKLSDFEKIIIYPNPAKDVIYINFIALNLPVLNINIYDIAGKLVKSTTLENINIQTLNVDNLNTGVYIFEFKNGSGETIGRKKIMVLD